MTDAWTPLKLLQWTASHFEKLGILNPRLDAELLLAHVLGCARIDLYIQHERTVPEKDRARFKELVQRRSKREPLQYIVGETEFWGRKFRVSPDVLIPRPETELLIEESLRLKPPDILEIGTGSGCLAVTLACELPTSKVVATDVAPEALEAARRNAKVHGAADRIEFVLSDIAPWKRFQAEERRFDLILSNPPYIPTGGFPALQPEVRDFEPRRALDGGPDGLTVVKRILTEGTPFLKLGGRLLIEIGSDQGDAMEHLSEGTSLIFEGIKKDYSGHDRIALFKC